MKKIVALILSTCLLFNVIAVYASSTTSNNSSTANFIVDKHVATKDGSLSISGKIPVVSSYPDASLQRELNAAIEKVTTAKIEAAKKDYAKSINFSNHYRKNGNYNSIIVNTSTTTGSAKEEVNAFVFDSSTNKQVSITDILGPNGIAIADKVISAEMKKAPEKYNTDFKGISETQNFYVERGNVVITFDEYQIAPGSLGVIKFHIAISDVTNVLVSKGNYNVKPKYALKMLPLRSVCEGLGFEVKWDDMTKAATISKGNLTTKITVGENKYSVGNSAFRELESAPELHRGTVYVPISFFDVVLKTSYSVDENDNLTFSDYK